MYIRIKYCRTSSRLLQPVPPSQTSRSHEVLQNSTTKLVLFISSYWSGHASVRSFRYRQGSVFRYRYGFDPSGPQTCFGSVLSISAGLGISVSIRLRSFIYIYIYTHIDTYHKYIYIYIHINIHINLSLSIHIYIYIYIHRSSRPQPFAGPHLWSLTLESHTPSPPTPGLR